MKKKAIAILLCLVMALALLPVATFADGNRISVSRVGATDREVNIGDSVTLAVDVCAWDMSCVQYEWRDPSGKAIDGEILSTLTIQNFSEDAAGDYTCRVTDGYGNYDVVYYYLEVENHLTIQAVGSDEYKPMIGDTITLGVKVSADDMSGIEYSWYIEKYDELLGLYLVLIEGANSDSLTLEDITADKLGSYYCRASDDYGNSTGKYFTVSLDNHFSAAPVGNTECDVNLGENVTIAVSVTGDNLDGVMYYWSDPDNNIISTGASSLTLTNISQTDYGYYGCYVRDAYGNEARVPFNIYRENHFSAVPVGETEREEHPGDNVKLAVSVTADDMDNISYEWIGPDGSTIIGHSPTIVPCGYSIALPTDAGEYSCIVKDGYGNKERVTFHLSVFDNHLSVVPVGEIKRTVAVGDSVTLAVKATADDTTGLRFDWYKLVERLDGSEYYDFKPVDGANTDTLTVNVATETDAGVYRLVAYDSLAGYSKEVTFTVKAGGPTDPVDPTDPADPVKPDKPADTGSSTSGGSSAAAPATGEFFVTAAFTDINKVSVDGKTVAEKYYTVSGNVVMLSEEFLATLANGSHTVTVENATQRATAAFTVNNAAARASGTVARSPKTADAGVVAYGLLSLLSAAGIVTVCRKKERQ